MAEGKKSFVLYAEYKEVFEQLSNEDAGKLAKHIFRYVCDENPTEDNATVKLAFTPIKAQLKRDLEKWDGIRKKRSEAGKISAKTRQHMSTHVDFVEQNSTNPTVDVDVDGNVDVSVRERDNSLTLSHEQVYKETAGNEKFVEQTAMLLQIDKDSFTRYLTDKLTQMKITGKSSMYPLGTVKNIIIQDYKFKREEVKRGFKEPVNGGTYISKAK